MSKCEVQSQVGILPSSETFAGDAYIQPERGNIGMFLGVERKLMNYDEILTLTLHP